MVSIVNWEDQTNHKADEAEVQLFSKIKGDLTVNSDKTVILFGNEIVILITLQKRTMMLAHEGHQGIKKKKLLREKFGIQELKRM